MSKLLFKQKRFKSFKQAAVRMAKQKNAKLFHCYVFGDNFKIATAKKVQEFDSSSFDRDKEVIRFIQIAIDI